MTAEQLMGTTKIDDNAASQEIIYDKKFVSRWTDRCIEIKHKFGQATANQFAANMFSVRIIQLINKEIERRKGI